MDHEKALGGGIDLHCKHEIAYILRKRHKAGDRVKLDSSFFPEPINNAMNGEVVESAFDVVPYKVAVKLDNPPTYSNCRIAHRLFVSSD